MLANADVFELVIPLTMLAVFTVVGALTAMWYRRSMKENDEAVLDSTGSALQELRKLRRDGQISEQEFQVARNKLVAKTQEQLANEPSVLQRERDGRIETKERLRN